MSTSWIATAPRGRQVPMGLILAGLGLLAAGAVGVLGLDRLPFALCTFKLLTGLPCAGCGTTRALGHLFHLDVTGALAMNPLATLAAFAIAAWAALDVFQVACGRRLRLELPGRAHALIPGLVGLALALNWAYLVAVGR